MRADEDPPVCQTLMEPRSRLPHIEQRQRASGGSGNCDTSRCALWPHRRHSTKMVAVVFGMRQA